MDLKTKELLYVCAYLYLTMVFVHVYVVMIFFRENCGRRCHLNLVFLRLLWLLLEETCPLRYIGC